MVVPTSWKRIAVTEDPALAEAAALRGGNRNNPSAATPDELEEMFVAIW